MRKIGILAVTLTAGAFIVSSDMAFAAEGAVSLSGDAAAGNAENVFRSTHRGWRGRHVSWRHGKSVWKNSWRRAAWRASVARKSVDTSDEARDNENAPSDIQISEFDRHFLARFAEEERADDNNPAALVVLVLTRIGRLISPGDDVDAPADMTQDAVVDVGDIGRLSARLAKKIRPSDVVVATTALPGSSEQIHVRDMASGWTASALSGSGK